MVIRDRVMPHLRGVNCKNQRHKFWRALQQKPNCGAPVPVSQYQAPTCIPFCQKISGPDNDVLCGPNIFQGPHSYLLTEGNGPGRRVVLLHRSSTSRARLIRLHISWKISGTNPGSILVAQSSVGKSSVFRDSRTKAIISLSNVP